MKRYPPYDPIEYVQWQPDAGVMATYRSRIDDDERLQGILDSLVPEGIERLYKGLVRNRLYDITLKRWVQTGVLSKAWLGQGEEATTVGAVHALRPADVVGPMIRNAAACFEKGIPLADCLKVYLGTGDTITRGRDVHIGDLTHNVVSPVSLVGDLVPVMAGFALAFQLRGEERVALTWTGEGATRTGAVHEGLAVASARRAPLIVVVQDNGVALGTETDDRLRSALRAMPEAYGVHGLECDGNHVIDVLATVRAARELCLDGKGPVIVYARTFRMAGHATHDEREARQLFGAEDFRRWAARDPIGCFEEFLRGEPRLVAGDPGELMTRWEAEVTAEIEVAEKQVLGSRTDCPPDPGAMAGDVYG